MIADNNSESIRLSDKPNTEDFYSACKFVLYNRKNKR